MTPILETVMGFLIPCVILVGFFSYPLLQVLAIKRMRRAWLMLALLPLFVMIPVWFVTWRAFKEGSNLAPILLIFSSPVVLLYLIVLLWAHKTAQARKAQTVNPIN